VSDGSKPVGKRVAEKVPAQQGAGNEAPDGAKSLRALVEAKTKKTKRAAMGPLLLQQKWRLGALAQAENDDPQPQVVVALGFLMTN
jgi:hypothetical protein